MTSGERQLQRCLVFFTVPGARRPAEALWAFDECLEHPLPLGNVLLINHRRHCKAFRTFDGHCHHLGEVLPQLRGQN